MNLRQRNCYVLKNNVYGSLQKSQSYSQLHIYILLLNIDYKNDTSKYKINRSRARNSPGLNDLGL